jgi:hypothetical protein
MLKKIFWSLVSAGGTAVTTLYALTTRHPAGADHGEGSTGGGGGGGGGAVGS